MHPFDRHLWRLAGRIASQFAKVHPRQTPVSPNQALWLDVQRLVSRLDQVAARKWAVAVGHLNWQLQAAVRRLDAHLDTVLESIPPAAKFLESPSQRAIYEELLAARDEFEDFEADLRQRTLSVTTRPITLDEISLGRFQIVLDLTALSGTGDYHVTAKTPCWSAARSDVSHPHVLSDRLCEGDASAPLECALQTGRLCDFFEIIQQTLQTYNAESAYAKLEDWFETTVCHACGDRISESDTDYCEACDFITCDSCSNSCIECGCSTCGSCAQSCQGCDENFCSFCFKSHQASCSAALQPASTSTL